MNLKKCIIPVMGLLIIGALCACTINGEQNKADGKKKEKISVETGSSDKDKPVPTKSPVKTGDTSGSEISSDRNETDKTGADNETQQLQENTGSSMILDTTVTDISTDDKKEEKSESSTDSEDTEKDTQTASGESTESEIMHPIEDGRTEARENTFLEMIPAVTFGSFSHTEKTETFDYETYSDVTRENYEDYIKLAVAAGYSEVTEKEEDQTRYFDGESSNGWCISIVYIEADKWICIGCGYQKQEKESPEALKERLFTSTILSKLPVPTEGSVENSNTDDIAGSYVVLEGVTEDYAREYVELLKTAGFEEDVDSGDVDGFIWYMAATEDGISCNFQYWEGIMKIVCEYSEE